MKVLYESDLYVLENEYEVVFLRNKETGNIVVVGDHYGDPTSGYINEDETYCISCGSGIIIYYLRANNIPYSYDKTENQWKEYYRDNLEIETIKHVNGNFFFYNEEGKKLDLDFEL